MPCHKRDGHGGTIQIRYGIKMERADNTTVAWWYDMKRLAWSFVMRHGIVQCTYFLSRCVTSSSDFSRYWKKTRLGHRCPQNERGVVGIGWRCQDIALTLQSYNTSVLPLIGFWSKESWYDLLEKFKRYRWASWYYCMCIASLSPYYQAASLVTQLHITVDLSYKTWQLSIYWMDLILSNLFKFEINHALTHLLLSLSKVLVDNLLLALRTSFLCSKYVLYHRKDIVEELTKPPETSKAVKAVICAQLCE